ncbi:unnamed protein product [Penicillium salamii]|uniref:protein-ribulosamine 3-kinase n=1 Tax=Penicillium salamii TaxID=1612424 RepID=A0A9W4ILX4_9EURO|nr:unnamed protein product [Penicillium salamii]CAG8194198.1 unnamed protein product [Penicillium salamii]CAG8202673.1 unnamed protein product [Penicillium salamii]CAG8207437.1 unnamed protein product [Penicillium salamii]CAG8328225.1 unnamed protein product [Penicillium salamii]
MTRAAAPPILLQLYSAESVSSQIKALRTLKNELIGHDQRKEAYIADGIIPALAQVLTSNWPGTLEPEELSLQDRASRKEESDACLQATLIVGSLAQGGPTFLTPLFASNIIPRLLSILSSPDCPDIFCLPILRLLNTIADRLPLQSQEQWPRDTQLADLVFTSANIGFLRRTLSQDYKTMRNQAAIELTASLIGKLCSEESHKTALAESGVLDALALKIASFVVAKGFVLPGAEDHLHEPGALEELPLPAPPSAQLAPILRAVAVIIEQSKWRAEHFLSSPGIVTVFPKQVPGFAPSDIRKAPWGSTYLSGSAVPRHGTNPMEQLLPSVPLAHSKSSSHPANFPPLGHGGSQRRSSHSFAQPLSLAGTPSPEDDENMIVPWLLCILRSENGVVRLVAARLVTILFRLGLAKKHRVPMFSYLLIPILVRMLDKDFRLTDEDNAHYDGLISPTQRLKEEAPAVLANLVMDDQELQRHAVEGNALKRLSQLLKETYNPVSESSRPMWQAEDGPALDIESLSPECRLGPSGYSPTLCHVMRYRENILKALAALVPFKDEYRKAICEHGVVPYIIDALKPRPSDALADASMPRNTAEDGNPIPTILAACGTARMLTRSVSVLRTSLIDAGVAEPLFTLLRHSDTEVQIAATAAICNLALDFSPMKEAIISANIIPILCEHAHSTNTKLQIESLWALKHMVYDTANDIRMNIVQTLGPEWIMQVISRDPVRAVEKPGTDEELDGSGIAMGRSNSAGEQVDILNPMDDATEWDEDLKMTDTMPPSKMSLDMFLPDARRRRKLVLHGSLAQTTQSRQDDIAVQEQTFDLLRNMICGADASEMIDYLFRELGHKELLDIIVETLQPRNIQLNHRREPATPVQTPYEIIKAATALLVHLAAGHPRHRRIVAFRRDLVEALGNYFNHSHKDIRSNFVWIVINLIYEEDTNDREGCRERAARLWELHYTHKLTILEGDSELDIVERAKTAMHLLHRLDDPTMTAVPEPILQALALPSKASLSKGLGSGFTSTATIHAPVPDSDNHRQYFVKTSSNGTAAEEMFTGESESLNAIAASVPGFCPKALAHGALDQKTHFLATEYLDLGIRGKSTGEATLAQRLGKLHSTPAPPDPETGKRFGFPVPTFCGDTKQPNRFCDSWADFYANERLLTVLGTSEERNGPDKGLREAVEQMACVVVPRLLGDGHLGYKDGVGEGIMPVVIHGDLWSGNADRGRILGEEPGDVVYDPSACYGHSEFELGIMNMFGGFGGRFFEEYHALVPKTEPVAEYKDRVELYELYHHLNHHAIFGGGYRSGAMAIMDGLIQKYGSKE